MTVYETAMFIDSEQKQVAHEPGQTLDRLARLDPLAVADVYRCSPCDTAVPKRAASIPWYRPW